MANDRAVSIVSHFSEIKRRIIRIAIVVILSTIISFIFYQPISKFVQKPALDALSKISPDIPATLVFLDVFEGWSAIARLSVLVGFTLAFPYIMFELVMFLRPGLTKSERKYLYSLIPGGTILFFLGVAFAYYILIPPAVHFLFSFGANLKKINIEENTINIKKLKMKRPLDGSLANVWTEFRIPDLTKNVPVTLIVKVKMLNTMTHE